FLCSLYKTVHPLLNVITHTKTQRCTPYIKIFVIKDCPLLGCSVIQLYMKGAGNNMHLDDRSYQLFQELMEKPSAHSKDVEESCESTGRRLGESFGKINAWLREKTLPAMERTREGHFNMAASILTSLGSVRQKSKQDLVTMPESQRVHMIILMLLG